MYTSNPSPSIRRRLNRHASTILLGGIFLFFSLSFLMAMCKVPCDNASAEYHLMKNAQRIHKDHEPKARNYSNMVHTKLKTYLVILILTGPSRYDERNAIRNTWLSSEYPNVKAYFAIGTSGLDARVSQELQKENAANSDLLLLPNTRDSYQGLTHKLIDSFKWLDDNVDFHYVLKADDDTFVKIDQILLDLKSKPNDRLYWGFFDGRANVKKTGQWAEKNWILCDKYGPHARGGGYVLSCDLVSFITSNSALLQKFNSEDISVGTWLGPLNIHREHDPKFDTEYRSRGCNNKYIVTHKQSISEMKEKWTNLKTSGVLCTKESQVKLSYVYNWKVLPSECCSRNDTKIP